MRQKVTKELFLEVIAGVDSPEFSVEDTVTNKASDAKMLVVKSQTPFAVAPVFQYQSSNKLKRLEIFTTERKPREPTEEWLQRFMDRVTLYSRWYREFIDGVNAEDITIIREPQTGKKEIRVCKR